MKKYLPMIITITLLLIFIIIYIVMENNSSGSGNKKAYIYQNSELIKVVDLSTPNRFTITGDNGLYNVIEINEDGKIGIIKASCPDNTCVHTGFTDTPSKPIICLPNKLEIKISQEDNSIETDIDSYSY